MKQEITSALEFAMDVQDLSRKQFEEKYDMDKCGMSERFDRRWAECRKILCKQICADFRQNAA